MSDSPFSERDFGGATRDEIVSAIFAQMILQQVNMAMMLLGKVAHPQTGKTVLDLDSAQMFIDQLEVIQIKTKGNLNKQEDQLLSSSLTSLRMAFVEAVHQGGKPTADPLPDSARSQPASEPAPAASEPAPEPPSDAESKKKFSKKY